MARCSQSLLDHLLAGPVVAVNLDAAEPAVRELVDVQDDEVIAAVAAPGAKRPPHPGHAAGDAAGGPDNASNEGAGRRA